MNLFRPSVKFFRRCERGLWLVAAGCLLWVGWAHADSWIFYRRNVAAIQEESPAAAGLGWQDRESTAFAEGTPLGLLRIPRLGLESVVAEGTTMATLRRAVGHLEGTAVPGRPGNATLAGHRDTHFQALQRLRKGDEIVWIAGRNQQRFEVEWIRVVSPDSVEVLDDPGYPVLTLVTCFPFRYVGRAPLRYVVRARSVDDPTLRSAGALSALPSRSGPDEISFATTRIKSSSRRSAAR